MNAQDFSGEEEALESLLSSIANQVEFLSKAAGSTDRGKTPMAIFKQSLN